MNFENFGQKWPQFFKEIPISQSPIIRFACLSVCLCVDNRLPNHVNYRDETFTGDSIGLEKGRQLNLVFKEIFKALLGENAPEFANDSYHHMQVPSKLQLQNQFDPFVS